MTQFYAQYEAALCSNDVETLDAFFWNSPHVVRFGLMENLHGSDSIKAYRQSRSGVKLQRELFNFTVTAFGAEMRSSPWNL